MRCGNATSSRRSRDVAGFCFNDLIAEAGIHPSDVRLLRHESRRHTLTPYALWRDDPIRFNDYQRVQKTSRHAWFDSPIWASFVVSPDARTLFVGLYRVSPEGPTPPDWVDPISGRLGTELAEYQLYHSELMPYLQEYSGRLVVDWGNAARSWHQRAANQDKRIVELREKFVEAAFPGFAAFVSQLSEIESIPETWRTALASARGVYLLTCPRTREQYVGAATGSDGFLGRWRAYVSDQHGGNVELRIREPSDYRVSILQVAGSADERDAVLAMESLWKTKLQSREMGLNRN
jgi:hypothetical protein